MGGRWLGDAKYLRKEPLFFVYSDFLHDVRGLISIDVNKMSKVRSREKFWCEKLRRFKVRCSLGLLRIYKRNKSGLWFRCCSRTLQPVSSNIQCHMDVVWQREQTNVGGRAGGRKRGGGELFISSEEFLKIYQYFWRSFYFLVLDYYLSTSPSN